MKYTRKPDGTVELDGDPNEISDYHKRMVTGFPKRKCKNVGGSKRARYSSNERRIIITMSSKGKSDAQIARALWRKKVSPIKRSGSAIHSELIRIKADPNRR